MAGAQILSEAVDPTLRSPGAFAIAEASKFPSVLQGMPEVEDFATPLKEAGAFPDPIP